MTCQKLDNSSLNCALHQHTDYGHTKAKYKFIFKSHSQLNQFCQKFPKTPTIYLAKPKSSGFQKKRLHWASIVHALAAFLQGSLLVFVARRRSCDPFLKRKKKITVFYRICQHFSGSDSISVGIYLMAAIPSC